MMTTKKPLSILRGALAIAATAIALLTQSAAQAADANVWQKVQKAGVLRCGAAVAAPYVMKNPLTNEYSGVFSNICRDFGENVLKVKVEFVDTTWSAIVAGVQGNKWDMAMALNPTPERALAVAFSIAPVDYHVNFLVHKDNPKFKGSGTAISDFDKKGVNVAVMAGAIGDKATTAVMNNTNIMRLPGQDETRLALMSKRADILSDAADTNHLFALANDWVREINPNPAIAKQGIAFGLPRDISPADLAVLNIYITHRIDNGDVERWMEQAFAQAAKTAP